MVDISGCQLEIGRFRRGVGTRGDVEFVRRHHAIFRISKLPPKLMADDCDVKSRLWLRGILNREDDACSCKKQNDHDKNRNHGPSKFDLSASVNLSWFTLGIPRACAKATERNSE